MFNGFCGSGNWGFFGDFGVGSLIGLALNLIFLVGLTAALGTLVVWAIRRGGFLGLTVASASGQPTAVGKNTAQEILQAQYARGEITREQYELKKQDIG